MISVFMRTGKSKPLFDEESLYEYAVRSLAGRMRSVAEIKRLMQRRASGENAELLIDVVVARLKQNHYLDDRFYAATLSTSRRDHQKLGKMRVVSDLKARGVHADVIRETVDAAYGATPDEQQARKFLRRKRLSKPKD